MAFDTGKYRSYATKKEGVVGSGNLLNPSFENWTLVGETYEIDDWNFFSFGDAEVKIASYARSEDSVTGDSSIELTSYADDYGAIGETKTGLTPGDWKIIKINTKSLDSTQLAIGLLGDEGETNIILNWVTGQWGEGNFEDDYMWFFNVGTDWEETISIPFQVPDSGIIQILGIAVGEEGAVTLIDDFDIYDYTPAEDVALFDFESDEDATKLLKRDYILLIHTTGGTSKNLLSLDYNAMFSTTANWLGCDKDFLVPTTRTYYDSALNGMTGICVLNNNPPVIDLLTQTQTKISDAPVLGKAFIPTQIAIITTQNNSAQGNAIFSIGQGAPGTSGDIINSSVANITYSTNFGKIRIYSFGEDIDTAKITDDLYVDVASIDTGTICKAKFFILGYYINDFEEFTGGEEEQM